MRETDRNRNFAARSTCGGRGDHHDNRISPEQGVDSRPAASMREKDRHQASTEQNEFPETPIGFDGRGHLQDSDGSKALNTVLAVLGSSRGRVTRRILSQTWEPGGGGWPQQGVETNDFELKDKLPREQPMTSGQKRRWKSGARQSSAMTALQLGTSPRRMMGAGVESDNLGI